MNSYCQQKLFEKNFADVNYIHLDEKYIRK